MSPSAYKAIKGAPAQPRSRIEHRAAHSKALALSSSAQPAVVSNPRTPILFVDLAVGVCQLVLIDLQLLVPPHFGNDHVDSNARFLTQPHFAVLTERSLRPLISSFT